MNDFDLIAIRHGRTAWNADGRFQGQTDVPLDDVGREQARRLAALVAPFPIRCAIASDLSRARETAEIVLAGRGVAISADAGWREMQFGAWEGLTWTQIAERYPEAAARTRGFPQPVDGESFDQLSERIAGALTRAAEAAADLGATASTTGSPPVVLVATHAGPLHALLRVALGESEGKALSVRFQPATYTRLAFRGGVAALVELNVGGEPAPV